MVEITQNIDGLRSLSQLFTSSNFKKIVRKGDLKTTNYRLSKHLKNYKEQTYSDIFRTIYVQLLKYYRSEYFYKNALLNKIVLSKYRLKSTTVLNEFKIGSSWADFVLLNGEARIYEIKTELDSLSKLEKQLKDYLQFGNKVFVVSGAKHSKYLLEEFKDSEVGIIEFTKQNRLRELKEARINTEKLNHTTIFKTLRKSEYIDIIKSEFGFVPNVPNTKIFKECLDLARKIEIQRFQSLALNKLKNRKLQCPEYLISINTPTELRHLCHTMDLNENEYLRLYSFLNKDI